MLYYTGYIKRAICDDEFWKWIEFWLKTNWSIYLKIQQMPWSILIKRNRIYEIDFRFIVRVEMIKLFSKPLINRYKEISFTLELSIFSWKPETSERKNEGKKCFKSNEPTCKVHTILCRTKNQTNSFCARSSPSFLEQSRKAYTITIY